MTAGRVVPALDELEACHAGLALGRERAPIEQLAFECGEEALATIALSKQSPTDPIEGRTLASLQRSPKATDVYCDP